MDTTYEYLKSQNNNWFDPFNHQLYYILADCFAESKIIKCIINKFLSNPLLKFIFKKLSYYNADEWMKKLSTIL